MPWPPTTHQHVEDEITSGMGWATTLAGRARLGENTIAVGGPLWVVGRHYTSAITGGSNTTTVVTNAQIRLSPFYAPVSRAVDSIGIEVSTAGAGGSLTRLGIYNSDPTSGLPTTVRVDAGTVASDSTGYKNIAISTNLHGLVWLAIMSSGGTYRGVAVANTSTIAGGANPSDIGATYLAKTSENIANPLPDLTGASLNYTNGTVAAVAIRAA